MNAFLASLALLTGAAHGALPSPAQSGKPRLVRFQTADGWTIAGLYRPSSGSRGAVILVHGVAAGKSEWDRLTPRLWALGLGTLAVDQRGHGDSLQGPRGRRDFSDFDSTREWPKARKDLDAAVRFLAKRVPPSRIGVIGGSIGANLASQVAVGRKLRWVALRSPGEVYRGVTVGDLRGRLSLAAASPEDLYAYETAKILSRTAGASLLEAPRGHGAQMLEDPRFLDRLCAWIDANAR